MKPGLPTPVKLTAYSDRTFTFQVKSPPTSWFLKKCANIEKGSAKAGLEMVGKVTLKQIFEIALIKHRDVEIRPGKRISLHGMCRSVAGTARTMGLQVIDGRDTPYEQT